MSHLEFFMCNWQLIFGVIKERELRRKTICVPTLIKVWSSVTCKFAIRDSYHEIKVGLRMIIVSAHVIFHARLYLPTVCQMYNQFEGCLSVIKRTPHLGLCTVALN